jgi:hypothetical protein
LAACGGSGTPSGLSHSQLVSKVSSACSTANLAAANLSQPGASYSDLASYAKQLSPIVTHEIAQFSGLKADKADQPTLEHYVDALKTGNRGLTLLASATTSAQAAQAASVISSRSITSLADALGVPACASTPDS